MSPASTSARRVSKGLGIETNVEVSECTSQRRMNNADHGKCRTSQKKDSLVKTLQRSEIYAKNDVLSSIDGKGVTF